MPLKLVQDRFGTENLEIKSPGPQLLLLPALTLGPSPSSSEPGTVGTLLGRKESQMLISSEVGIFKVLLGKHKP